MNFQDCHEEEIQFPSHIQDYGYLIGLNESDQKIRFYSENLNQIFQWEGELLDKKLTDFPSVFEKILHSQFFEQTITKTNETQKHFEKITLENRKFHLTLYRYNGFVFIEIEPFKKMQVSRNLIFQGIKEIQSAVKKEEIWEAISKNIFEISGYDRVMVYKFMPDGTGKVIAEHKREELESFLHLHYPESDIPKQARELYTKNYKRIFSNVHAKPVRVISELNSIDLTYSTVRAMSPLHGVYIKNSGASSSFSTSINVDNKLWGLVTCQNVEPRHIDLYYRVQAEICTMIAANAYSSLQSKQRIQNEIAFSEKTTHLKTELLRFNGLKEPLFKHIHSILAISNADGFAISYDDEICCAGKTPSAAAIQNLSKWFQKNNKGELFSDQAFYANHKDQIDDLDASCSGLAATFIGENKNIILYWFRNEYREHIHWAGNPEKSIGSFQFYNYQKEAVSPRSSFTLFLAEIKDKSKIWTKKDLAEIQKIHDVVLETLQLQIEKIYSMNQELQKLNDELDSFSHTISHDLATPLTVIKLNLQRMQRQYADKPEDKEKFQSILNEIDNMTEMITNVLQLSRVKHSDYKLEIIEPSRFIEKICEDSRLTYDSKTEIIIGEMPEILGESTLVYQVFQNMITNAVKYSSQKVAPQVRIDGKSNGKWVTYQISDNGIGIPEDQNQNVFKLFNRIENAKSFAGTGVGLAIVQRIMNRLEGNITFDSKLNEGTTFTLKFKKPEFSFVNPLHSN